MTDQNIPQPGDALPRATPREQAESRFFTANSGNRPPATDEQKAAVASINEKVVELAVVIELLVPGSRNKSLALTALEDVSMRANRALFATGPSA